MRYRSGLPLVLHDLTVSIEPGARCGVVSLCLPQVPNMLELSVLQ